MHALVGLVSAHGIGTHLDLGNRDAQVVGDPCDGVVLIEYHVLEPDVESVLRRRSCADNFSLVQPADGAVGADIVGLVVLHTEIVQIIGEVTAEDAVSGVAYPENILDFRKEELGLAVDQDPPIGENQKIF